MYLTSLENKDKIALPFEFPQIEVESLDFYFIHLLFFAVKEMVNSIQLLVVSLTRSCCFNCGKSRVNPTDYDRVP